MSSLAARSDRAAVVCSRRPPSRPPPRCTGKWCSTIGGTGKDNPTDLFNLDHGQKSKAVSLFFRDFSKFDVSDALAAHTTTRRVGRAQRQVPPGRRSR